MKKTFDQLERGDIIRDTEDREWVVEYVTGDDLIELRLPNGDNPMPLETCNLYKSFFGETTYKVTRPRSTFTISIPGDWDAEDFYREHLEDIDDGTEAGAIVDMS